MDFSCNYQDIFTSPFYYSIVYLISYELSFCFIFQEFCIILSKFMISFSLFWFDPYKFCCLGRDFLSVLLFFKDAFNFDLTKDLDVREPVISIKVSKGSIGVIILKDYFQKFWILLFLDQQGQLLPSDFHNVFITTKIFDADSFPYLLINYKDNYNCAYIIILINRLTMGGALDKSASPDETREYFEQEWYILLKYIDLQFQNKWMSRPRKVPSPHSSRLICLHSGIQIHTKVFIEMA